MKGNLYNYTQRAEDYKEYFKRSLWEKADYLHGFNHWMPPQQQWKSEDYEISFQVLRENKCQPRIAYQRNILLQYTPSGRKRNKMILEGRSPKYDEMVNKETDKCG